MDVSLISLNDATALLEMYGEPIPDDPVQVYNAVYDLLSEISPDDPIPTGIEDLYVAQDLTNIIEHVPIITLSDILFSSEDDLIDLSTDLGLSEVDKERIIRILGYLGKLENDTSFIDTLPLEIVEEIAVNLDCKSLFLLCSVSKKFNSLCNDSHVLKRIIRNKGYQGNLEQVDVKELKSMCHVLESGKFVPREAYSMNNVDGTMTKILDNIVQVSVGFEHYLFLSVDGRVYGFGNNFYGVLGLPEFKNYTEPQLIPGLVNIKQVSAGHDHTLCLSFDGKVYGLGNNSDGQLGPLRGKNSTPKRIPGLNNIVQVSAGAGRSLCLRDDGQVYGFGVNLGGELGFGHGYPIYNPALIPKLNNIKQVLSCQYHSLFLTKDGQVYGLGSNFDGQLGLGNIKQVLEPKLIPNIKNIVQVAGNDAHSLFLRDDGQVYAVGNNDDNQLGFPHGRSRISTRTGPIPKLIPKLKNIVQVSAGKDYSLCLSDDGKVYILGHDNITVDLRKVVGGSPVTYPEASRLNEVITAGNRMYFNNSFVLI